MPVEIALCGYAYEVVAVHVLRILSGFVFVYPALMGVLWIVGGLYFWWRRERKAADGPGGPPAGPQAQSGQAGANPPGPVSWPPVTILVPCHNEARTIARTCLSLSNLSYPDYRVLFIDDASTDGTVDTIRPFVAEVPFFHLLRLEENLGKAAALNAGMQMVTTPLVLVLDADTILGPGALELFVAPFLREPRLGAVTGNPLPHNRSGLLGQLQAAEFASVIGLIKRSHRVWGRILTVSGCATMYRTEVLRRVDGFSPETATDDIDITWRIQRAANEVWFEPRAVAYIQVPVRPADYFRQRYRWALGGWHLLRTHRSIFRSWRWRRLWPVYLDFLISYVWAFCFVGFSILWAASLFLARSLPGLSPIPAWHGAALSVVSVTQLAVAVCVNERYDPGLSRSLFWVPWYPLVFFAVGAVAAVWSAPRGLLGRLDRAGRWRSPARVSEDALADAPRGRIGGG